MRDDGALRAEAMLWDYEFAPPNVDVVERDDVLMWRSPSWPVPWRNRVSVARWDRSTADDRIGEVLAFFADLPFTWHVGPSSSPGDLGERLENRGLKLAASPRMMTAPLPLQGAWRSAPGLRIVDVEDAATARVSVALAHHAAADLDRALADRLAYLRVPARRGGFLVAYLGDTPVANAGYRYSSDGACVYLTGAETVEAYRGRGIYQALIVHRARTAHLRGCRLASILANVDTSRPILERRGFADHGALPRYERV